MEFTFINRYYVVDINSSIIYIINIYLILHIGTINIHYSYRHDPVTFQSCHPGASQEEWLWRALQSGMLPREERLIS